MNARLSPSLTPAWPDAESDWGGGAVSRTERLPLAPAIADRLWNSDRMFLLHLAIESVGPTYPDDWHWSPTDSVVAVGTEDGLIDAVTAVLAETASRDPVVAHWIGRWP